MTNIDRVSEMESVTTDTTRLLRLTWIDEGASTSRAHIVDISPDDDWADVEDEPAEIDELVDAVGDELSESHLETSQYIRCCQVASFELPTFEKCDVVKRRIFYLVNNMITSENIDCTLNTIKNMFYLFLHLTEIEYLTESEILLFLQSYYKYRHDLLFKLYMKSFNVVIENTDVSFKSIFDFIGLSNKTPDYVLFEDGKLLVIEFTAVTDVERAQRMKGDKDFGYESKYESDFKIIREHNIMVTYIPIIFDVGDVDNKDYQQSGDLIKDFLKVDVKDVRFSEIIRKEFCGQSFHLKSLVKYTSTLFERSLYKPSLKIKNLSTLLTETTDASRGRFKTVAISNRLLETINQRWDRLYSLVASKPQGKYRIEVDASKLDIVVKRYNQGIDIEDWVDAFYHKNLDFVLSNLTMIGHFDIYSKRHDNYYTLHSKGYDIKTRLTNKEILYNKHPGTHLCPMGQITITEEIEYKRELLRVTAIDSVYKDDDYYEKVVNFYKELSPTHFPEDLLCHSKVDEKLIDVSVHNAKIKYMEINKIKNFIYKPKVSFLYPIRYTETDSYGKINEFNQNLIQMIMTVEGGYTSAILKKVLTRNFNVIGDRALEGELFAITEKIRIASSEYNFSLREHGYKKGMPFPKECESLRSNLQELNRQYQYKAKEKIQDVKAKKYVKVNLKGKNNFMNTLFKQEMKHFKSKNEKALYKGVGAMYNEVSQENNFENLVRLLSTPVGLDTPIPPYCVETSKDIKLFMDLKNKVLDDNKINFKKFINTQLAHAALFVSRLCHTLEYLSQANYNGHYVAVDNLGYTDVMLLVKGGEKIFRTKSSKLFRLCFPVTQDIKYFYGEDNPDYKFFYADGKFFVLTPWIKMNETMLSDGITWYFKISSYVLINLCDTGKDILNDWNKYIFNILVGFNNRRKLETALHKLRYVIVNSMSDFSDMRDMLADLLLFNYDRLTALIFSRLLNNFPAFAKKLLEFNNIRGGSAHENFKNLNLKHLVMDVKIDTLDELTHSIYSTFMMSKAPVTQSLEQANNAKEIMKIHDEYIKRFGVNNTNKEYYDQFTCNINDNDYLDKLFDNDFMYDPHYCYMLGNFAADYFKEHKIDTIITSSWNNIMKTNWDTMANTSGLRDDISGDFFNDKGYYVIYKHLLENKDVIKQILSIINTEELSHYEKENQIKKLNNTFKDACEETELEQLYFHVVDKKQRGGGREIYVMSLKTKLHQQPLERLFAVVCKHIPNELISIPSNQRMMSIHSKVFEGPRVHNSKSSYYVLDCRKWAPKSNILKYVAFMLGAKEAFPNTFMIHFLNFFDLMLSKKVIFKKFVKHILDSNLNNKQYCVYLESSNEFDNADELTMPYSFVMGIFNYLSSYLHAINQLFASHLISKIITNKYDCFYRLMMLAHSDDSAGTEVCDAKNYDEVSSHALGLYEIQLKSCNHLISRKKSNKGKVYFEFLSVLYIARHLLTLLVKFMGLVDMKPTDKGYTHDILLYYNKCMEMIMNGATFNQTHLACKIMSQTIFYFYFHRGVSKQDYNLPPQLFGVPDAHPLIVILSGSDSDILRLMNYDNNNANLDHYYSIMQCLNLIPSEDSLFNMFVATPGVYPNKKIKNLQEHHIDLDLTGEIDEVLSFYNTSNGYINIIKFLKQLKNKAFLAALQDESLTRRISRSYFFRHAKVYKTTEGLLSMNDLKLLIELSLKIIVDPNIDITDLPNKNELLAKLNSHKMSTIERDMYTLTNCELIAFVNYLDTFDNVIEYEESKKDMKPVHVNLIKSTLDIERDFDPMGLMIWIRYPQFRYLIRDSRGYHGIEQRLYNVLGSDFSGVGVGLMTKILNKIRNRSLKSTYVYSNLPPDLRVLTTYSNAVNWLSHNNKAGYLIKKLCIPMGRNVTSIGDILNNYNLPIYNYTASICLFCNCIISANNMEVFNDLIVNPKFNFKSTKLLDLLQELAAYWNMNDSTFYHYISYSIDNYLNKSGLEREVSLENSFWYCYTKRQLLRNNVWIGRGSIFVNTSEAKFHIYVHNNNVNKILTNKVYGVFSRETIDYLNYVLNISMVNMLSQTLIDVRGLPATDMYLGVQHNGSYAVDSVMNLHKVLLESIIDPNMDTPLANINSLVLKHEQRGKIIAQHRDPISHKTLYTINLLMIDVHSAYQHMKDLFITQQIGDVLAEDYVTDFFVENASFDCTVDFDYYYNSFASSRSYHIYNSVLKENELTLDTEITNTPASEGSFVDVLMRYAELDDSFKIKVNKVLTPELLTLRAHCDNKFIINTIQALKDNFNRLYDEGDKTLLVDELFKIVNETDTSNKITLLTKMLMYWGYSGVAGVLDTITTKSLEANKLIDTNASEKYSALYFDSFIILMKSLYESLYFVDFKNIDVKYGIDCKPTNVMTTIVFLMVYRKFKKVKQGNFYISSLELIYEELINAVYSQDLSMNEFIKSCNNNLILSKIINVNANNTKMIFCSLLYIYLKNDKTNFLKLDYFKPVQRTISREEIVYPYTLASQLFTDLELKGTLSKKGINHHGLLPTDLMRKLMQGFTIITNKRNKIYYSFDIAKKVPAIPIESGLNKPLIEDAFDDDDWEELVSECNAVELDDDTISDFREKFIEMYEPFKIARIGNDIQKRFKVIIDMAATADKYFDRNIIQQGFYVLIICDCVLDNLITNNPKCRLFRMTETSNKDNLIIPKVIFWHVIDPLINPHTWIEYFKLEPLDLMQVVPPVIPRLTSKRPVKPPYYKESMQEISEEFEKRYAEIVKETQPHEEIESFIDKKVKELNINEENMTEELRKKIREIITTNLDSSEIEELISHELTTAVEQINLEKLVKTSIQTMKTKEELDKVYTLPEAFGFLKKYSSDETPIHDSKLRAEINSLKTGLCNKLTSGNLTISRKMYELIETQVEMYRMVADLETDETNQNRKCFFIDLLCTIIKGSFLVDENDDDSVWIEILKKYNGKFISSKRKHKSRGYVTLEQPGMRYGL